MKTKLEILNEKIELRKQAEGMVSLIESENRKFNSDEQNLFDELRAQMTSCDEAIKNLEERLAVEKQEVEKRQNTIKNNIQKNTMKSIVSEIRSRVDGSVENKKFEVRAFTATLNPDETTGVGTKGGETVPTEIEGLLTPLHDNQVLSNFTMLTGLTGNVSIPAMGAVESKWKGEGAKADETDANITSVPASPKRLTSYAVLSRQLLFQSNSNIEAIVREEIVKSVADKLQKTILGTGAGDANQPKGLFYGATALASNDFAGIVALEQSVEEANAVATGYIINPSVKAQFRTKVKAAGQGGFLFDAGELDGMPTSVTNAASGILYGNLKDIVLCQFDNLSITVDTVTLADQDEIKIVINSYWDCVNRREGQNTVVAKTLATANTANTAGE